MTTATHSIVGFTTGLVAYNTGIFPESSQLGIVLISVTLANIPDLNLLWHKDNLHNHHNDITHYPIFWIIIVTVSYILEISNQEIGNHYLSLFVGISVLLHLLMDTFGNTIGVYWLYPLSKKEYSFTKLNKHLVGSSVKEMLSKNYHGKHIWIEFSVWILCLLIIAWGL